MIELKNGESVSLTNGSQAKILKELGRGGQGIVYLVDVGGQKMALKWYLTIWGIGFTAIWRKISPKVHLQKHSYGQST